VGVGDFKCSNPLVIIFVQSGDQLPGNRRELIEILHGMALFLKAPR